MHPRSTTKTKEMIADGSVSTVENDTSTSSTLKSNLPQHSTSTTTMSSSASSTATATISSCVINLANTIVGAGMLGLPGAFGGTGYIGGTILLLMGATFSSHGLMLLSKSALLVRERELQRYQKQKERGFEKKKKPKQIPSPSSFYTVARAAVPQYTILIDLAVALKCFGVATGYLITVSDCMVEACSELIAEVSWVSSQSVMGQLLLSRQFWTTFGILCVLPLSFYTTLNSLHGASTMALMFVFFLILMVISYAEGWGSADPCWVHDNNQVEEAMAMEGETMYYDYSYDDNNKECRGEMVPFTSIQETFSKLPIFIFAFTCQQNIFPVVNELQNPIIERLRQVVMYSIILALGVYMIVAIEGYRTFGSNTKGDILLNYPQTPKVTIMRLCIAMMLTLHYPLQLDPSRRCFMSLIKVIQRFMVKKQGQRKVQNDTSIVINNTGSSDDDDDGDCSYDNGHMEDNDHYHTSDVGVTYYKQMSSTLEDGLTSQQRKEIELFNTEQNSPPFSHIPSSPPRKERLLVNEQSRLSPRIETTHRNRVVYHGSVKITDGYGSTPSTSPKTLQPSKGSRSQTKANDGGQQQQPQHSRLFYGITGLFLLCSWMLAMIVDDLGVVLALVGATGSTLVSYVLPGLIYIQLHKTTFDRSKCLAYGQLILGLLIMPVALYFVLTGHSSH